MKNLTLIALILTSLIVTGCEQTEKLQADFNASVDNIKKEAADVQKQFEDTKKNIETNVKKVENLVNAVKAFSSEEKETTSSKQDPAPQGQQK
jgi:archaellum component FlaC